MARRADVGPPPRLPMRCSALTRPQVLSGAVCVEPSEAAPRAAMEHRRWGAAVCDVLCDVVSGEAGVTEKLAAILGKEKPRTGRPAAAPEAMAATSGCEGLQGAQAWAQVVMLPAVKCKSTKGAAAAAFAGAKSAGSASAWRPAPGRGADARGSRGQAPVLRNGEQRRDDPGICRGFSFFFNVATPGRRGQAWARFARQCCARARDECVEAHLPESQLRRRDARAHCRERRARAGQRKPPVRIDRQARAGRSIIFIDGHLQASSLAELKLEPAHVGRKGRHLSMGSLPRLPMARPSPAFALLRGRASVGAADRDCAQFHRWGGVLCERRGPSREVAGAEGRWRRGPAAAALGGARMAEALAAAREAAETGPLDPATADEGYGVSARSWHAGVASAGALPWLARLLSAAVDARGFVAETAEQERARDGQGGGCLVRAPGGDHTAGRCREACEKDVRCSLWQYTDGGLCLVSASSCGDGGGDDLGAAGSGWLVQHGTAGPYAELAANAEVAGLLSLGLLPNPDGGGAGEQGDAERLADRRSRSSSAAACATRTSGADIGSTVAAAAVWSASQTLSLPPRTSPPRPTWCSSGSRWRVAALTTRTRSPSAWASRARPSEAWRSPGQPAQVAGTPSRARGC
ncbi:unnamed protein product [Prorocentrum cordatum]|uniref:Apple domain-containing protein n=1 Tax=Prorocentrum cordatum TaxID=2364126 RepID=A0ABN9VPA0_9DINO|nr:unnamed protein product [Polarella glacialis]